jgi:uncharacterized damage-inducible protein DinB
VEYHIAMTRRVWDSVDQLSERDFLAEDSYSRGSIRNLMVHLASVERRWLTGLKNLPDVGHLKFEDYPTKAAARTMFEQVSEDLGDYVRQLDEVQMNESAEGIPSPRWQILMHLVNHGTDHRATVLQRLQACGAPTFDQDLILWLWEKH